MTRFDGSDGPSATKGSLGVGVQFGLSLDLVRPDWRMQNGAHHASGRTDAICNRLSSGCHPGWFHGMTKLRGRHAPFLPVSSHGAGPEIWSYIGRDGSLAIVSGENAVPAWAKTTAKRMQ